MEDRKKEEVNIKKWQPAILQFSLMLSVAICLVAFEWKSRDNFEMKDISNLSQDWTLEDIPQTIQSPPPPPQQPIIPKEIPNDQEIEKTVLILDIDIPIDQDIVEIELPSAPPKAEKADEIVDFTEVQASFKGGMDAWYAYLRKSLKYPKSAQNMGIEGMVIIRFVINKDGSVQDVEVVRSLGGGCDEVATEVIENSPNWNPGKTGGAPVRSRMVMPIKFKLN